MNPESTNGNLEQRVLVLGPANDGADEILRLLASANVAGKHVTDLNNLCWEIDQGAGAVVWIDPDDLVSGQSSPLIAYLWRQPVWSDLPIILLSHGGAESPAAAYARESLGNVVPLDRNVSSSTLVSAVQTALRARQRQYQARQYQAERAAAEQALNQSQQHLNLIANTAPIAIVHIDCEQRFTFANTFIAARLRMNPTTMIGKTLREVMGHEYAKVAEPLERAFRGQEVRCELSRDYPGIGLRHLNACFVPDMDETGEVCGVVMVWTDVTEDKQAREAVQSSERKFRTIFESTQEGILLLDDDRVVVEANPAAILILGLPMDRILGQNLDDFLEPTADMKSLWMLAMEEGCYYGEHVIRRPDGENREVEIVCVAKVLPQKHLLVAHDITDQKQIERALKSLNETLEQQVRQRTAEAEERAKLLQELASELTQAEHRERRRLSQMLHDHLQQLLVAARLRISVLRERCHAQDSKHAVEQVDDLLRESIQASRSLTVELSPPILFDAGLAPALEWLGRKMEEEQGLQVRVKVDQRAEPASDGVRAFLFQSVRELLFNVVKHAQVPHARITLTLSLNRHTVVTVEDEGRGFEPRILKERQETGEVFGLSSIHQRLQLLGGDMEINSSRDRGTRIRLSVPVGFSEIDKITPVEIPPEIARPSPVSTGYQTQTGESHRIRVLLADDHKILREGLARLLREQIDMDVVGEASNGLEAVRLAFETRPNVVIMDTSMPQMNGIDATRRILSVLPWTRVIGLSMHDREHMADAMCNAGAIAYFTKDGPSEELIAAIRQHAFMPPSPSANEPASGVPS